jgi:hypothetical protein
MPLMGFEPTISPFDRAKTVHALDRAAAVIGAWLICHAENTVPWSVIYEYDFNENAID